MGRETRLRTAIDPDDDVATVIERSRRQHLDHDLRLQRVSPLPLGLELKLMYVPMFAGVLILRVAGCLLAHIVSFFIL